MRPRTRSGGGVSAFLASIALAAGFCALADAPQRWKLATRIYPAPRASEPLDALWAPLARMVPTAELAQRLDVLAIVMLVACAGITTWAAGRLFRGRGGWLASVAAGPLTALCLMHWLHQVGPVVAVRALPITALAVVAVVATLQPLTQTGHIPAPARVRSMAAAAVIILLSPRAGVGLAVLLAGAAWVYEAPTDRPQLRLRLRRFAGHIAWAAAPAGLAAVALAILGARWIPLSPFDIVLRWPGDGAHDHVPAAALYSGLALIAVVGVRLRKRGGPLVVLSALACLTVGDGAGPWAPTPASIVVVSVAAAGWIWLLGTRMRAHRVWSSLATAGLVGLVLAPMALQSLATDGAIAEQRPPRNVARGLERGLVAPGDGLFAFGPWTTHLRHLQVAEGFRPDVEIVDAARTSNRDMLQTMMRWDSTGRRILSDRFDGGGGWTPVLVVDSGPLFWLVGRGANEEREFTDLERFEPEWALLDDRERRQWGLVVLERARFRRALGEPEAALQALVLSDKRTQGLITRLKISRRAHPESGRRSEVPPLSPDAAWDARARFVAEAADIMYEHGEHQRAAELFAEASDLDPQVGALGALARWQLRAGESEAVAETLGFLASSDAQRREAIDVVSWTLRRHRWTDARLLLENLGPVSSPPELELAARVRLLDGLSFAPTAPATDAPAPTVSQRTAPPE